MKGGGWMARFGDALATGADLVNAAERAALDSLDQVDGTAELVCFFVCWAGPEEVGRACNRVMDLAGGAITLGCSATGVIGGGRGVESQGAVSVWCARLPKVDITPFRLDTVVDEDHLAVVGMSEPGQRDRVAIMFANHYVFPSQAFVSETKEVIYGLQLVCCH